MIGIEGVVGVIKSGKRMREDGEVFMNFEANLDIQKHHHQDRHTLPSSHRQMIDSSPKELKLNKTFKLLPNFFFQNSTKNLPKAQPKKANLIAGKRAKLSPRSRKSFFFPSPSPWSIEIIFYSSPKFFYLGGFV
jgi:hypothetical protein